MSENLTETSTHSFTQGVEPTRFLTPKERMAYNKNGYVLVPNIFPLEELQAVNREIDGILQRDGESHNSGWVMQLGLRSEITRQFAQDERILSLIEDIVKPGIAIYSGKLTAKLPHSDAVCHWHQDDAYYTQ